MKALSVSEAEMKLGGPIETINATDGKMMITQNAGPTAVLVNPGEFESLKEPMTVRSELKTKSWKDETDLSKDF
jgi:PHD/YefM family antitoxin component YafN of YafNO toxin-antitoxin module